MSTSSCRLLSRHRETERDYAGPILGDNALSGFPVHPAINHGSAAWIH